MNQVPIKIYPLKLATGHHYYRLKVKEYGLILNYEIMYATDTIPAHYKLTTISGTVRTTIHETVLRGVGEGGLRNFQLIECWPTKGDRFYCVVSNKRLVDIARRCLSYSTNLTPHQVQTFGTHSPWN